MPRLFLHLRQIILDLPMRRKLLVALITTVSLPLLGLAIFALGYFLDDAEKASWSRLHDKHEIGRLVIENSETSLLGLAKRIAADHSLVINLELGLGQSVTEYLGDIMNQQGLDFASIVDAEGTLLAAADRGEGSSGAPLPPAAGALQQAAAVGGRSFWLGPDLDLTAVVPVLASDGRLLGHLSTGWHARGETTPGVERLDARLARQTGADLLLGSSRKLHVLSPALEGIVLDAGTILHRLEASDGPQELRFDLQGEWRGLVSALRDHEGRPAGFMAVARRSSELTAGRWISLGAIFLVFGLAFVISFIMARWFAGTIAKPVAAIARATQEIIRGNFHLDLVPQGKDEIGLMTEDFSVMSIQLQRLIAELEREVREHQEAERQVRTLNEELEGRVANRTAALNDSLELLQRTQAELVESEKMAALSHMVVGIAHELNTPVGTSLTASTYLEELVTQVEADHSAGTLTSTRFVDFLKTSKEIARLHQANLKRASHLVGFFKEMAVNGESEAPVMSRLRELIEFAFQDAGLQYPERKPLLVNMVDPGLELPVRTIPLTKALTAILENTMVHAFDGRSPGVVSVSAALSEEWMEMVIYDDGVGIPEGDMKRIFEPFYTTRRASGHVGLGLSIAFNLVTQRLGGTIQCENRDEGGTCVRIRLPA